MMYQSTVSAAEKDYLKTSQMNESQSFSFKGTKTAKINCTNAATSAIVLLHCCVSRCPESINTVNQFVPQITDLFLPTVKVT